MFDFVINCQHVVQSDWTTLHPHRWYTRNPFRSESSPAIDSVSIFTLMNSKCFSDIPISVFICVCHIATDIKHLSIHLFALWLPALVKCSFKFFPYFLNWVASFLAFDFWEFITYSINVCVFIILLSHIFCLSH